MNVQHLRRRYGTALGGYTRHRRVITTLDPKKLQPSDCYTITGHRNATYLTPKTNSTRVVRLYYGAQSTKTLTFPFGTTGFLYYHTPPKAPPLVGGIRFRIAQDRAEFDQGTDLLSCRSLPWNIPLLSVATVSHYAALREQLLRDGLVTPTLLKQCTAAKRELREVGVGTMKRENIIYYLRQPLYMSFSHGFVHFIAVTPHKICVCSMVTPFWDSRVKAAPYGGSGIVQLEPYKDPQYPNESRLAFRILKVIDPVYEVLRDYSHFIHPPVEGSLVQRSFPWQTPTIVTRSLTVTSMRDAMMLPLNLEDIP